MEEMPQAPEPQPVEQPAPPPRKGKALTIVLICLAALAVLAVAALIVFAGLRSSPQIRHISRDAVFMARVDLPRLLMKGGFKDRKKSDMLSDLRDLLQDMNMEMLIDKPASTGLLTIKPSYVFADYNVKDNEPEIFLVVPLSDGAKLAKFLGQIETQNKEDLEIKKKGEKYVMETSGLAWVWNRKSLLIGVTAYSDFDTVQKKAARLLDQPRAQSIAANSVYKQDRVGGHDVEAWVNLDAIAEMFLKGLRDARPNVAKMVRQRQEYRNWQQQYYNNYYNYYNTYGYGSYGQPEMDYPKNIFEQMLLSAEEEGSGNWVKKLEEELKAYRGSSVLAYADFDRGRVVAGVKSNLSKAQKDKMKGILSGLADLKGLARYLPNEDLISCGSLQMNYSRLWEMYGRQAQDALKESLGEEAGKFTKHLNTLFDGSGVICVNSSGKEEEPYFTVAVSTRRNQGVKSLLKNYADEMGLEKKGNRYESQYGNIAILEEQDCLILTSDYKEYKKAELGLRSEQLKHLKGGPLAGYFSMAALTEAAGDEIEGEIKDVLDQFVDAVVSSGSSGGVPNVLTVEVNLTDKKQNSLKTLMDILQDQELFDNDYNFLQDIFIVYPKPVLDASTEGESDIPEYADTVSAGYGETWGTPNYGY